MKTIYQESPGTTESSGDQLTNVPPVPGGGGPLLTVLRLKGTTGINYHINCISSTGWFAVLDEGLNVAIYASFGTATPACAGGQVDVWPCASGSSSSQTGDLTAIECTNCGLVSLNISGFPNINFVSADYNALSGSDYDGVNGVLWYLAQAAVNAGYVSLANGTNAALDTVGTNAKAVLAGAPRLWQVYNN